MTTLIADLIRAGVAPDLIGRIADAIADARSEGASIEIAAKEALRAEARKARNVRYYKTHSDALRRLRRLKTTETSELLPPLKEDPHTPKETNPSNTDGGRAGARARGTRLPDGWAPSEALCAFAADLGFFGHSLDGALAEFRDYWRGVPGRQGLKLDWDATFRNRLRETAGKKRGNGNGKRSISDVAPSFIKRLDEQFAYLDGPQDRGADGGAAVRLLPAQRGQRS